MQSLILTELGTEVHLLADRNALPSLVLIPLKVQFLISMLSARAPSSVMKLYLVAQFVTTQLSSVMLPN